MIFWQIFKTQVESNASQPEQPVSETVEGTEELPEPVQAEQMAVEVDSKVLQITEQKVKKVENIYLKCVCMLVLHVDFSK
jgi:hypothetical protein